ncbi:Vacuolar protein sorting-associated protein 41 [Terramyces sp. JEL0728]|nr:Vacuolar protein sorting-associated protein 41 [Terramyces sp. JEL0728]
MSESSVAEEPKLKYSRLAFDAEEFQKDSIACLSVSDRFLAIGTLQGAVQLIDLIGTPVKKWQSHTQSVNQISIDTIGEFIASASGDGNVIVNSLYSTENYSFSYKRPIFGVALEPDYGKKSSRQIVSGGIAGSLIMTGKGWFGNTQTVLHSGEGSISAISWNGNYIVWANDKGTNVYDIPTSMKFGTIEKSHSARGDPYRCNICWKNSEEFLIGWADTVKIISIKERSAMDKHSGLSPKHVQVLHQFRTEFVVAGIAPFQDDILLLSFITDALDETAGSDVFATKKTSSPPEIHIVSLDGLEVANDVLSINGFENYQANDYRLEYLAADQISDVTYYISSPKSIIVAKPRDIKDHIEWQSSLENYQEALDLVDQHKKDLIERDAEELTLNIGQKYLESLMGANDFEKAAEICSKVLGANGKLWENWVYQFAEARQLTSIYRVLPVANPQLSSTVYELIINDYINTDLKSLLSLVKLWPPHIYNIKTVIKTVEGLFKNAKEPSLIYEILVNLFNHDHQTEKAILYAMKLKLPGQIDLIVEQNLLSFLHNNILHETENQVEPFATIPVSLNHNASDPIKHVRALVGSKGTQLLVEHTDHVPPSIAVKSLEKHPEFLHIYLDALFLKDHLEGSAYHERQVELYAEYDPPRLIDFLRTSSNYSYPKAYQLCEQRDLIPEMMYLLGKMGDNRKALMLIIERVGDVNLAIEFAKEHNDSSLWEEFLNYAMDKPAFIVGILENLGNHISPLKVIERIPLQLPIPGLKKALMRVMTDCSVQTSLQKGCEKILLSDTWDSFTQLNNKQRRGIMVSPDALCSICDEAITQPSDNLVVFFCHHYFHANCINMTFETEIETDSSQERSKTINTDRAIASVYSSQRDKFITPLPQQQTQTLKLKELSCPICSKNSDTIKIL